MCGIIAYIGEQQALPILIEGLKRLEYRGYDSAGVVLQEDGEGGLTIEKTAGKVSCLEAQLRGKKFNANCGAAHTRWATHGEPTDQNAHPHFDCKHELALVHNGIIENYRTLKILLEREGHAIRTNTDTEILVHLIEKYYIGDLTEAVRQALRSVEGTYGIAVISSRELGKIVVAKQGSPLVIGLGDKEYFVASDASAFLSFTKKVCYLKEGEIATITSDGYRVIDIDNNSLEPKTDEIRWTLDQIEKGGYDHFMLKEIHEQSRTLRNTIRGRLSVDDGIPRLDGLNWEENKLSEINRIIITACGTSWHAALIGEYLIETLAKIPVEVEYASEFRYRSPIIDRGTLVIVISQSGETADTLAALRESHKHGAKVLGVSNVVGSTIARETDGGVYIHAGPEIGVASTKAFTSQVMVLAMIAILLGRNGYKHALSADQAGKLIDDLKSVPELVKRALLLEEQVKAIAQDFYQLNNFLYLGRGINFPVALEGALKLKEISYIHAEGYPAAEMKHGPIALIDENMPVVVIALKDAVYDKVMSNIAEIMSRQGIVIAIASEGDQEIAEKVKHAVYIPNSVNSLFTPLLSVIPLQLFAYHMAVLRGRHIDQPRNLAKSVTVE